MRFRPIGVMVIAGALVAAGAGLPVEAQEEPPGPRIETNYMPFGEIAAELRPPKTLYTANITDLDGHELAYGWLTDIQCGNFFPNDPSPNMATWSHANEPPDNCTHEAPDHPGAIRAVVDEEEIDEWSIVCVKHTSASGEGEACRPVHIPITNDLVDVGARGVITIVGNPSMLYTGPLPSTSGWVVNVPLSSQPQIEFLLNPDEGPPAVASIKDLPSGPILLPTDTLLPHTDPGGAFFGVAVSFDGHGDVAVVGAPIYEAWSFADWDAERAEEEGGARLNGGEMSAPQTDSGQFWSFAPDNVDIQIKVLDLHNPNLEPNETRIDTQVVELDGSMAPGPSHVFSIPPLSTESINLGEAFPGWNHENLRVEVVANAPIVALMERGFDTSFPGLDSVNGYTAVPGQSEPGLRRLFPFGTTQAGFRSSFTFVNPNSEDSSLDLNFLREAGSPPIPPFSTVVPGESVLTLPSEELFGGTPPPFFSTEVQSGRPLFMKQDTFFDVNVPGAGDVSGAASSLGTDEPARTWSFASGMTGPDVEEFIAVGNPSDVPVTIDIEHILHDGTTRTTQVVVPARSRVRVAVEALEQQDGEQQPNSLAQAEVPFQLVATTLRADGPVVAERELYFDTTIDDLAVNGGSLTMGATETGPPVIDSSLSISFKERKKRFSGRVDAESPCESARTVSLKRKGRRTRTVGRATSNQRGRWKIDLGRAGGPYFAVTDRQSGEDAVCLSARSRTLEIRR